MYCTGGVRCEAASAFLRAKGPGFEEVRQLRGEMDGVEVMPGVFDPGFVGESQHAGATHMTTQSMQVATLLAPTCLA